MTPPYQSKVVPTGRAPVTRDPAKASTSVLSAARAQARASGVLQPQRAGGQLSLFSRPVTSVAR